MTATLVLGIGFNYAALLHQPVEKFLPYVAIGLVMWGFISAGISEGADVFVAGAPLIKQSSLPLPLFALRGVIRNGINLAHQVIIVVAVLFWFRIFPGAGILWSLLGLAVVLLNLAWIGLMLAMICARFRDMPQIVSSVLQVVFFLSPIFWVPTPEILNNPIVYANPFYLAVQVVREPLLGGRMATGPLLDLVILAAIGWGSTILVYNQTRRRVVHYL